jgi:hypothetical protein
MAKIPEGMKVLAHESVESGNRRISGRARDHTITEVTFNFPDVVGEEGANAALKEMGIFAGEKYKGTFPERFNKPATVHRVGSTGHESWSAHVKLEGAAEKMPDLECTVYQIIDGGKEDGGSYVMTLKEMWERTKQQQQSEARGR